MSLEKNVQVLGQLQFDGLRLKNIEILEWYQLMFVVMGLFNILCGILFEFLFGKEGLFFNAIDDKK